MLYNIIGIEKVDFNFTAYKSSIEDYISIYRFLDVVKHINVLIFPACDKRKRESIALLYIAPCLILHGFLVNG